MLDPSPGPARRAGFTFVELAMAMTVLLAALLIFSSVVGSMARQRASNRETTLAVAAARNTLETLRSEDFAELFALYNGEPSDDPSGPGTAPGNRFPVVGLDPVEDAPDGLQGEIVFPTRVGEEGRIELREDVELRDLGLPRDLSGDNVVDGEDHAGDYFILPVRVRVRWKGASGVREYQLASQLCRYQKS